MTSYQSGMTLARLRRSVERDSFTDVFSRRTMMDRIDAAMVAAVHEPVALFFVDLDGFKAVNDVYGHQLGDRLLVAVGARLGAHVRKEDVAARFGGDEFCVILDALSDPDAAELASRHLLEVLNEPYTIGDQDLTVTASIGIGCFPRDGETIDALLERADERMYREKRRPRIVSSRG